MQNEFIHAANVVRQSSLLRQFTRPTGMSLVNSWRWRIIRFAVENVSLPSASLSDMLMVQSLLVEVPYLNAFSTNVRKSMGGINMSGSSTEQSHSTPVWPSSLIICKSI